MHQEQGEVLIGVVALGELVDVMVFSTSAKRGKLVVEGLWVGWIHLDKDNWLDLKIEA